VLQTPDATVTPTSPPLPLTYENLRALTKMASGGPSTPKNKGTTSGPSTSKSAASKKTLGVPAEILGALKKYNICVDEIMFKSEAFNGQLADFIEAKMMSTRSSPTITVEKHQQITSLYRQYGKSHESVFSEKLKDHIFTKPGFLETISAPLECVAQVPFRPGSVPIPDTSDDYDLETLLKDCQVPRNPVPDHLYGLRRFGVFSKDEVNILAIIEKDTRVAPELYFPFLTIEWKSEAHLGNAEIARTQAARSGAAIVSDMRNLYAHIAPDGNPDSLYPDHLTARTACFSCIIAGLTIEVFVHWFRFNEDGRIEWHSTRILAILWAEYENSFTKLHKVLHNILSWGTVERKDQIKEVLKTLGEQRAAAAAVVAGHKRKASASSPQGRATT